MKTSTKAGAGIAAVIALAAPVVMTWEGVRLDPYVDLAGIQTVCWGQTGVEMRTYSRAECDVMLERSLVKHAGPVLSCLPPEAPVEVKAAFVSFGFNVGTTAACTSKAAEAGRAGDYGRACDLLMNWVYVKKQRIQGLVNRRLSERKLCLQGLS